MTYEQWQWAQELQERFPNEYDPTYVPLWHGAWSDYEEYGWIYILEKVGQLYVLEGGYSVMTSEDTNDWRPYPVTYERVFEILEGWEEHLD